MNTNILAATVAVAVLTGTAATAGAASADNSGNTNCPAGYQLLSVKHLESLGPYVLPGLVDGHGNQDGYVCGLVKPLGYEIADCHSGGEIACELLALGLPLYHFRDDDVPSERPPGSGS
jgi:hypothetical protein